MYYNGITKKITRKVILILFGVVLLVFGIVPFNLFGSVEKRKMKMEINIFIQENYFKEI